MINFGKNIKYLRQLNGLSQQQFANLFELSRGSIGSYEEGRADPKIDTLVKISTHFKVSIDQLVTGDLNLWSPPVEQQRDEQEEVQKSYLEDRVENLEIRLAKLEEKLNKTT